MALTNPATKIHPNATVESVLFEIGVRLKFVSMFLGDEGHINDEQVVLPQEVVSGVYEVIQDVIDMADDLRRALPVKVLNVSPLSPRE